PAASHKPSASFIESSLSYVIKIAEFIFLIYPFYRELKPDYLTFRN
ncbi:MAG: hypothetical protein H2B00_05945, partial [Nitrosopumilaceae archaeon]|nr:hypothetical protein [Nitrosopumilaceae archaeon]